MWVTPGVFGTANPKSVCEVIRYSPGKTNTRQDSRGSAGHLGLWVNEDFPGSLAHNFTFRKSASIRNVRVAHQNRAIEISAQTTEREQPTLGQLGLHLSLNR